MLRILSIGCLHKRRFNAIVTLSSRLRANRRRRKHSWISSTPCVSKAYNHILYTLGFCQA